MTRAEILALIAKLTGARLSVALDLTGARLAGAYLSGAYLTRANLRGADLRGADLRGAYLTRADFSDADLTGANLTRANLRGAYLTRADLTDADLTGARLAGSYLSDADLTGADLTGAVLAGAYLTGANLSDADLTRAIGIATEEEEEATWAAVCAAVRAAPHTLDMAVWHGGCGTTHCIAGWAQHLSTDPEIKALRPEIAGSLLLPRHAHLFLASTEDVRALIFNIDPEPTP